MKTLALETIYWWRADFVSKATVDRHVIGTTQYKSSKHDDQLLERLSMTSAGQLFLLNHLSWRQRSP